MIAVGKDIVHSLALNTKNKKRPRKASRASIYFVKKYDLLGLLRIFFLELLVFVLELVNSTSGIDQFSLTGIVRVRSS